MSPQNVVKQKERRKIGDNEGRIGLGRLQKGYYVVEREQYKLADV